MDIMDNERMNQIETEIDRIDHMFVDVSYIQMLNGFNEINRGELIDAIKDIWRFAVIHYECSVEEYSRFINIDIKTRFVQSKFRYTEYFEALLNEMVEYLNKVLVNVKFKDESKQTILMEPCYDIQRRQFISDDNHKWELLKNTDIYARNREDDNFIKSTFVEAWNDVFKTNEDLFNRIFGLKYSDVENWSYEKWVDFHYQCKAKDIVLQKKKPNDSTTNEEKLEAYTTNTIFENQKADEMIKSDMVKANNINPEKWMWLIENHEQLVITQEIQTYYKLMNTINKSMYCAICDLNYADTIGDTVLINSCLRVIYDNIDIATKFPQYSFPDMFLLNMCKGIYEERNPHKNAGRPQEQHLIKMIDAETEEVFERFNCRQAVIDTIGIKKSRLSKCLKSSKTNPNAKSIWTKFKFDDKWYWFVEEN